MIIFQILRKVSQKIEPLEAEILLAHILKVERIFLYKNPTCHLSPITHHQFKALVNRRLLGEPLAYLTNQKEFYGLDFYVDERVFIPRPETELLVEQILEEISNRYSLNAKRLAIADVGTGSGCISVAIARQLKIENLKLKIFATDISNAALEVAKINAKKHRVLNKIIFLQGGLLKPLPEKVDIIVANLPYVKRTDLKNLKYEPKIALEGGENGLDFYKKLLSQASQYLKKNGKIFLEISPEQKEKIKNIARKYFPKAKIQFKKDLACLDRIAIIN